MKKWIDHYLYQATTEWSPRSEYSTWRTWNLITQREYTEAKTPNFSTQCTKLDEYDNNSNISNNSSNNNSNNSLK